MISVKKRLERVFSYVKVKRILLVNTDRDDPNFLYLTGLKANMFEGCVLLVRKDSMIFFVDPLVYGMAKKGRVKEMRVVLLNKSGMLSEALKKELKGKRVGINGSFMPYGTYKTLKAKIKMHPVDVSKQLMSARLVKDHRELKDIKRAVAITKRALAAGKASLKVGMSEKQAAAAIDMEMLNLGCAPAFVSIVSFDSNTALVHHAPDDTRLKPNSIVLMDIGARYKNYCGDITRTFMFKPDRKSEKYRRFADMHKAVLQAQRLALEKIREGMPAGSAHRMAESYIDTYKGGIYKKSKFMYMLGHSIGIDVHDGGAGLYPWYKMKLKRNMVFSDEPGIYIQGFGGVRIEDDVVVGKESSKMI